MTKLEMKYDPFDRVSGESYAWIQWKGTDVCCDVHCHACGYSAHVDEDFFYYWQCRGCSRKYAVGTCVRLKEIDDTVYDDSGINYTRGALYDDEDEKVEHAFLERKK